MAKYITVICKVKGETILKLNNDLNLNNDIKDNEIIIKNNDFINQNIIKNDFKYEFETQSKGPKSVQQLFDDNNHLNEEYDDNNHSNDEEYDDNNHSNNDQFEDSFDGNSDEEMKKSFNNRSDGNENLESYKKYLMTTRKNGKLLHLCSYEKCKYETFWSNAIVNHIRSHIGQKPFKCNFPNCNKSFTISCNLNNHKKVHTGRSSALKRFWAQTRGKTGHNLKGLTNDQRLNSNNSFENRNTGYINNSQTNSFLVSSKPSDRRDNSLSNYAPNKYVMYSKARKRISTIRSQQRTISSLNSSPFTSSLTNKVTNSQRETQDLSQSSIDSNASSYGIKSFDKYLKITTKNGKMWRLCQFKNCNYGSNLAASMVHHIRTHLNDRPFKCRFPNCGKAFTILTNLNNHKKVHRGRRNV